MSDAHPLTQEAFDRLSAELADLTTRGRIDVADKIERARELGDLSENGDYQAAKDEQGHMEGRIRQLESLLANAEIVEATDDGKVGPGMLVTIRYEDGDEEESYVIASIEEQNPEHETLTPQSALGQALMDAKAGDIVSYEAPTGAELTVKVVRVGLP